MASGHKKLEIRGPAQGGTGNRRLVCLAQRVTVLRSVVDPTASWLVEFIEDKDSPPPKPALSLDDKPLNLKSVALIGFAGRSGISPTASVEEYLVSQGISRSVCNELLTRHFMHEAAGRKWAQLTPELQRGIQLLALTQGKQPVAILNDPFKDLSDVTRESLAAAIATAAAEHALIVVVVNLNNRPHCWVENEYVTRLQIERPENPTIGFGEGAGIDVESVRQRILMEMRQEEQRNLSAALLAPGNARPGNAWPQFQSPWLAVFGVLAIVLLAGVCSIIFGGQGRENSVKPVQPALVENKSAEVSGEVQDANRFYRADSTNEAPERSVRVPAASADDSPQVGSDEAYDSEPLEAQVTVGEGANEAPELSLNSDR